MQQRTVTANVQVLLSESHRVGIAFTRRCSPGVLVQALSHPAPAVTMEMLYPMSKHTHRKDDTMRILRSLLPALLAATTLGSGVALAAEPSPQQPAATQAGGAVADETYSTWDCYTFLTGGYAGRVTIWWGHRYEDAVWACHEWRTPCRTSQGGCYAVLVHS